jgi:predicted nucleic acid-binding protein
MAQAVAIARLYLAKSNVECLAVDAGTLSDALALVERRGLGRGRLADALLASALLRAGVKQVITCNASDFDGIPGLLVVDPREPPGA